MNRHLFNDEGASLVEYALVLALIALVCIAAMTYFGDSTAYMLGRVTLNPVKHIDPMGTIVFPLVTSLVGGVIFGWTSGWELVFLFSGLVFGVLVGAFVAGMSGLSDPAPGDEPRS